jgi:hypothetical protein
MVEGSGAQAYDGFSCTGARVWRVFELQDLGVAERSQEHSFHESREFYGQKARKQGLTFALPLRREDAAHERNRQARISRRQIAALVFAIYPLCVRLRRQLPLLKGAEDE